jgi:3-hydroxyisobutyrate dehydrogenase-like beta-hydroxyacid dehydrogenase
MVGGSGEVLEQCRPVLEAMGTYIYHVGSEVGSGQTLKLINNMLLGIQEVAASEAMVLGMKAGIDPKLLYEAVCQSTGVSWAFQNRMDRVLSRDFSCKGALDILVKDLSLALSMAIDLQTPLLLAPIALQAYQAAMVIGLAKQDDSAVALAIEKMAGIQIDTQRATG